jgi:F-type H+-transporting ATPase subunit c
MPFEVGIDERNAKRGKNQRREAKYEEKDDTMGRKELTRQKPSRYARRCEINRCWRATIALAGAAAGIGNALSSLIHSVARNPSLAKQLSHHAISGFALTEAIALSASMMVFFISFVFRWSWGKME